MIPLLWKDVLVMVPLGVLVAVNGSVSIDFVVPFGCRLLIHGSGLLLLRCYR